MKIRKKIKLIDKNTQFLFRDDEAEKRWEEYKKLTPRAVIRYARLWAKFMQYCINHGFGVYEIAPDTSYRVNPKIKGYQEDQAIMILAECWKYGGELQNWRNSELDGNQDCNIVHPEYGKFMRNFIES